MANISRDTFDPTKGYRKVIHQQGGAVLDFDFNEAQDLARLERDRLGAQLAEGLNLLGSAGFVTPDVVNSRSVVVEGGLAVHSGELVYIPDVTTLKVFNDATTTGTHSSLVYVEYGDVEVTSTEDPDIEDPTFGESTARLKRDVQVKVNIGSTSLPAPASGYHNFKIAVVTHDFDADGTFIQLGDITQEPSGLTPGELSGYGPQRTLRLMSNAPAGADAFEFTTQDDHSIRIGPDGSLHQDDRVLVDGTGMIPDARIPLNVARHTTETKTIYVDAAAGDDGTGDGSAGNPYRTISRAFEDVPDVVQHNVTIQLAAGVYREQVLFRRTGYTTAYQLSVPKITILGDTNNPASCRISGSDDDVSATRAYGVLAYGPCTVRFDGVQIDHCLSAGVFAVKAVVEFGHVLFDEVARAVVARQATLDFSGATVTATSSGVSSYGRGLDLRDCHILANGDTVVTMQEFSQMGFYISNCRGPYLDSARFVATKTGDPGLIGVYLLESALNKFRVRVTNYNDGLHLAYLTAADLESTCEFTDCDVGIYAYHNSHADVDGVTFTNVNTKYKVTTNATLDTTSGPIGKNLGTIEAASTVLDGGTAVAHILDTVEPYVTAGAKLLSLQNDRVEKFAVDKDGVLVAGSVPDDRLSDNVVRLDMPFPNFDNPIFVTGKSVLLNGVGEDGIAVTKSGSSLIVSNTDRGSHQTIFKNIANGSGVVKFSALSNNDDLRFDSAGIVDVSFDSTSRRVIYSASLSAGTGISVNGNQIANTDRGSSQSIFKRIGNGSGTQQFAANSNNEMLRFASGGIVGVAFDPATNKVTYSASLAAGNGISVSGNQITNVDRGSSQSIFKNIANAAGTTQFSAGANNDALQFGAGGIVGVSFNPTNKRVTYSASLAAGAGISVSGNQITNTGIISAQAGAGISVSGKNPLQITNTDRGSSQNIFKNIANAAGTTQFSATVNNDTLRLEGGTNIAVSFDPTTKKVTIAGTGQWGDADTVDGWHRDAIRNWNNLLNKPSTFPPSSHNHNWTEITNKPSTFPPSSHNHDDRYYTEAEADGRFLNLAGGTLTGTLYINDATAANLANDGALTIGPTTSTNLAISGTTIVARNNGGTAPLYLNSGSGDVYAKGYKVLTEANRSEFATAGHTHDWTQVTNKPSYATRWPSWTEVTNKPSTFPPSSHTHDDRYFTESEADGRFVRKSVDQTMTARLTIESEVNQLTLKHAGSAPGGALLKFMALTSTTSHWNLEVGANFPYTDGLVLYNGETGRNFAFRADGNARARGVWQDNAFDLAEQYDVTEHVEAGTVLTVDTEHDNRMAPTTAPYQVVTGVVSYHEAQLADNFGEIREKFPELNLHEYENAHSVGITGLIPTKVTNEGGPIRRGDLLVSSSTPGHAMRCDPEIAKTLNSRFVVGVALQNFDGEQGVINVQR